MNPIDVQILFADLQPAIVARSRTQPPEALAAAAAVLAEVGGILRLPMTFSLVPEGGAAPEPIPELAAVAAARFPRVSADPFLDDATRQALDGAGRRTLVVAGFATEVVVLHAVRSARRAGYAVEVVVDACGGMSERTEAAALRQIEALGATTTSVVTLTTTLAPDFAASPGREAFTALQKLRLA